MNIGISQVLLAELIKKQLNNNFMLNEIESSNIDKCLTPTLDKTSFCFSHTKNKYYRSNEQTYFSPFHSGQYSIFLYYLSRQVFDLDKKPSVLADKIYYLNKLMNGLDLYYEVDMPDIFMLDHPLGSVLGRATYGNFFTFSQQCTVGNNRGKFPTIGEHVTMFSGSKIIGECIIGDNVQVAANTYIKDTDIPSNSIVFGSSPNLIVKSNAHHSR